MSHQHDDLKLERSARKRHKGDQRRTRHEIHQNLHLIDDPEAVLIVDPKSDRVPLHEAQPRRKRLRHWKVKAWKRRTSERHRRNAALDQLIRAE